MLFVGLTGGIGSGKSAAGHFFSQRGITIVDADQGARHVVTPGKPALNAIASHFGADILQTNGELNRVILRTKIFQEPTEKIWLENLLHPQINTWINNQMASAQGPYAILESPLLLETEQNKKVDRILVVDIPETLQVTRASARDNNSEQQIKAIIAAQMPRTKRLALADDIIDNSGSLKVLESKVEHLHQRYLRIAAQM